MSMKKIFLSIISIAAISMVHAQETISPAPAQAGTIALAHATIHIGNGEVIEDGLIIFSNGKITDVRKYSPVENVKTIDCTGKQIYPGLISPVSNLGLDEVSAVPSTLDQYELGDINPNVRSVIAYNTDSKVIDNVRSNGILLANVFALFNYLLIDLHGTVLVPVGGFDDALSVSLFYADRPYFCLATGGLAMENGKHAVNDPRRFLIFNFYFNVW